MTFFKQLLIEFELALILFSVLSLVTLFMVGSVYAIT